MQGRCRQKYKFSNVQKSFDVDTEVDATKECWSDWVGPGADVCSL
jgi:hypothetical protein